MEKSVFILLTTITIVSGISTRSQAEEVATENDGERKTASSAETEQSPLTPDANVAAEAETSTKRESTAPQESDGVETTSEAPPAASDRAAEQAAHWYILVAGQKEGPLPASEIERRIRAGELKTHAAVSQGESEEWVLVSDAFPKAVEAVNAGFQPRTSEQTASDEIKEDGCFPRMSVQKKGIYYMGRRIKKSSELRRIFREQGSPEAAGMYGTSRFVWGTAYAFAISGGALMGIALGNLAISKDFTSTHAILLGVGGGVAVLGIALAPVSTLILKKAVKRFNCPESTAAACNRLRLAPVIGNRSGGIQVGFNF